MLPDDVFLFVFRRFLHARDRVRMALLVLPRSHVRDVLRYDEKIIGDDDDFDASQAQHSSSSSKWSRPLPSCFSVDMLLLAWLRSIYTLSEDGEPVAPKLPPSAVFVDALTRLHHRDHTLSDFERYYPFITWKWDGRDPDGHLYRRVRRCMRKSTTSVESSTPLDASPSSYFPSAEDVNAVMEFLFFIADDRSWNLYGKYRDETMWDFMADTTPRCFCAFANALQKVYDGEDDVMKQVLDEAVRSRMYLSIVKAKNEALLRFLHDHPDGTCSVAVEDSHDKDTDDVKRKRSLVFTLPPLFALSNNRKRGRLPLLCFGSQSPAGDVKAVEILYRYNAADAPPETWTDLLAWAMRTCPPDGTSRCSPSGNTCLFLLQRLRRLR